MTDDPEELSDSELLEAIGNTYLRALTIDDEDKCTAAFNRFHDLRNEGIRRGIGDAVRDTTSRVKDGLSEGSTDA